MNSQYTTVTPQSSHVSVSGLSQLPPGQGRGGGGDPGGGGARREHEGKMRRDENTPAHFYVFKLGQDCSSPSLFIWN